MSVGVIILICHFLLNVMFLSSELERDSLVSSVIKFKLSKKVP